MLIAQKIDNLLNGVSQRPVEQRHSSQAQAQVNGLSSLIRGLMKRPPLIHRAPLELLDGTGDLLQVDDAFVHTVNRDEFERYHVIVADDLVRVFDALTGLELTVLDPQDSMGYLNDDDEFGFRAATAGDTTVIVNRGAVPSRGDTKTDSLINEALLYVRQADYGTAYNVTLNGNTVGIQTLPGTAATARPDISTDAIASDLMSALQSEGVLANFTFTQFGSTIHVAKTDGQDFTLSVSDGLADQGLKAVKKSVQSFQDLPRRAPDGFTVEIAGDPESDLDNYWVRFDDNGHPEQEGVWREAPQPGTIINLEPTTMPHRLVRYGHVVGDLPHVSLATQIPDAALISLGEEEDSLDILDWDTAVIVGDPPAWYVSYGGVTGGTGTVLLTYTEEQLEGIDPDNNDSGSLSVPGTYVEAELHGAGATYTFSGDASELSVRVYLSCLTHGTGAGATAVFYKNDVEIYRTPICNAGLTSDAVYSIPGDFTTSDELKVLLEYSNAAHPTSAGQINVMFVHPIRSTPTGERFRGVWFNSPYPYPVGTVITIVADGEEFEYEVETSPATGAEIAAAFVALITSEGMAVNAALGTPDSVVKISNDADTFPVVTVSLDLATSTTFYNPTLELVVNELQGLILRNLTDNSHGTIQSNTENTIIVDALTGGVDNVFSPGDLCTVEGTGRYFVFEPCPWKDRGAGDLTLVPFPSFVDQTISDVFFYSNRLGFTSNENLIMSSSGDLFNFFRYSGSELRPDDVIDVRSSHAEVSLFHSAVLWNKGLYLVSNNAEWQVAGEPALTPQTVRIDLVASVPNTPGPRPVVAGNRMYLTRGKKGFTQVRQLYIKADETGNAAVVDSIDITQDSPKYIKGNPIAMAGDDTFLAVVTDDDPQVLYVYSYTYDEQGRLLQSSWSKWEFESCDIVAIDVIDGQLGMLVKDAAGSYFGDIDLNVMLDADTTDEAAVYLDRRLDNLTPEFADGDTTWTLPYPVATDGSEGEVVVVDRETFEELEVTRLTDTTVTVSDSDETGRSVYVGIRYEFRYTPTTIFYRNQQGAPETRGRTQLRFMDVFFNDSTDFDVVVTLAGRDPRTYSYHSDAPDSGSLRVPIQGRNIYTLIELVNSSTGACAFSLLDWEGDYTIRDRRV